MKTTYVAAALALSLGALSLEARAQTTPPPATAPAVNPCLNINENDCRVNSACLWLKGYSVGGKDVPGYCRTKPLPAAQFRTRQPGATTGPSVAVKPKTN